MIDEDDKHITPVWFEIIVILFALTLLACLLNHGYPYNRVTIL